MRNREPNQQYSAEKTARRRDAMLLRLLKTPPQPRPKPDVLIKMQLAEGLIQMLASGEPRHQEENLETEDRLMLAAYADLKRLTDQGETNVA